MDTASFAQEWVAAWNSRDLERILSHYAEMVVFTSPTAARVLPDTGGVVTGIDGLRTYWTAALPQNPDLHFELMHVLESVDGCTLVYRNDKGQMVAETMLFDEEGKVLRGIAAYEQ